MNKIDILKKTRRKDIKIGMQKKKIVKKTLTENERDIVNCYRAGGILSFVFNHYFSLNSSLFFNIYVSSLAIAMVSRKKKMQV